MRHCLSFFTKLSSLPLFIFLLFSACQSQPTQQKPEQAWQLQSDTLLSNLQNPWGAAFLPDGNMLITERNGTLHHWEAKSNSLSVVQGFPSSEVYVNNQGGLLDVQLHPQFAQNKKIYFSMSRKVGDQGGHTAMYSATLEGKQLSNVQLLFQAQPATKAGHHFGARIAFDKQGFVYLSMGDRGKGEEAQKLSSHNGTIIRLHDDGRVPADNPFVNQPDALPEIWSYGHRNVQGLYYDESSNTLWAHEHGPKGGDELNVVEKGKNYGWPVITYGIGYDDTIISELTAQEGMEQPVKYWVPSIAPCGMTMIRSDKYPGWENSILIGALVQRHIARLQMNGRQIVKEERLLEGVARMRWLGQSPDGYIYVLSEGPGMLLRLRTDK